LKRTVKVEIFGQDYTLRSEADDEHIQRVAELVDQKMREASLSTNSKNVLNIAILAALHIADEFIRTREERERAEVKARELTQLIDSSL
jgi:cell division protein ZapA